MTGLDGDAAGTVGCEALGEGLDEFGVILVVRCRIVVHVSISQFHLTRTDVLRLV